MKILRITILLCVVAGMSQIISATNGYRCTDFTLPNGNNCYRSYEGDTCHFSCNAGYALIGSSSTTCISTGWNGTPPFCDGEAWKHDITLESEIHSYKSHYDLAVYLKTFLVDKYPSVYWVVVVYDDISGYEAHTVKGSYHHLFRHYGHNIVVGRVILPSNGNEPSDISERFRAAYTPTFDHVCSDYWCWSKHDKLNAEQSVLNTWNNLYNQGLYPVMLHMFTSGIGYGIAHHFDGRLLVAELTNGGIATLIAES